MCKSECFLCVQQVLNYLGRPSETGTQYWSLKGWVMGFPYFRNPRGPISGSPRLPDSSGCLCLLKSWAPTREHLVKDTEMLLTLHPINHPETFARNVLLLGPTSSAALLTRTWEGCLELQTPVHLPFAPPILLSAASPWGRSGFPLQPCSRHPEMAPSSHPGFLCSFSSKCLYQIQCVHRVHQASTHLSAPCLLVWSSEPHTS